MERTFRNPILPGFHPDPSICRVGKDFYLTNSTFEFFPGLPIYHSRDLVHWKQIGNALDRPSQLMLAMATDTGGLYAPTLRYWKGLFYLTCDNVTGGGDFIVTARNPAGPWSDPKWVGASDIDGSMFFDDDGRAYYTMHYGGEKGGITQAEFDPQTGRFTTPPRVIWNDKSESWNEGPHLYKIKGRYYLMLAEGGTGDRHMEVIGRSSSPWGPFKPCPYNPILTERDEPSSPIQCTGHGDLVEAPDGSWWMVFLGTRPHNGTSVLGRETFLAPVSWTADGWPVVNGDHHVSLEMPAPRLPVFRAPAPPERTVFNGKPLGPQWLYVRNPNAWDFSLSRRGLGIRAASDTLDRKEEKPAFVAQRQTAFRFRARTRMKFPPAADGGEAGLCVWANEDNHYEIALGRLGGVTLIFVRNRVKGESFVTARQPLETDRVELEVSGDENQYQFAWSKDGKAWHTLAAAPAADLSRERAGGFTGTVVGLYATGNGRESDDRARFSWFEMGPGKELAPMAFVSRPTPTPPPSSDAWRINSGGGPVTDSAGKAWIADMGSDGGQTVGTARPIQAKKDRELYQSERWGQDFSYVLPVLPGKYRVTLRFAETYVKGPGQRVFDVYLNGKKALADFDIFKAAGGVDKAVDRSFEGVRPGRDGQIRIRFVSSVQNAKVCAVEAVKQQ